jgi:signal transduction histidine kinase
VASDLKLRIAGGRDAASTARHALDELEPRLQSRVLEDMRLLVSELVTNSIRHASVGSDDSLELAVAVARDQVRVEVTDLGPGFDPEPATPSRDGGGFGLLMVDEVADRWGVDNDGETCVWFEIER